jgi:hypothetical protein
MTDGSLSNDKALDKLDQIIKLLTPAPAAPKPKGIRNEFMEFLLQYKVLGLAVAFIIGVYLGAVVLALFKDLVMPVICLVSPGLGKLSTYSAIVNKQVFAFGGDFSGGHMGFTN